MGSSVGLGTSVGSVPDIGFVSAPPCWNQESGSTFMIVFTEDFPVSTKASPNFGWMILSPKHSAMTSTALTHTVDNIFRGFVKNRIAKTAAIHSHALRVNVAINATAFRANAML